MRETMSSSSAGSSEESIGRPAEWREGRYQQPGKSVEVTVESNSAAAPADPTSSTVNRKDYECLDRPPDRKQPKAGS